MSTAQPSSYHCNSWSSSHNHGGSINPPVPSGPPTSTTTSGGVGQRLLSLVRALDKKKTKATSSDGDTQLLLLRETLELFQQLIASVHRRGALQGDEAMAQQILMVTSKTTSTMNGPLHSRNNQRKSKRGRNGGGGASRNDLSLHGSSGSTLNDPAFPSTGGDSALLDAQLLWSALARVLDTSNNSNSTDDDDSYKSPHLLVLAAAADLCTAASEYLKTRPTPDTCFLAEYELVASHGRTILVGLEQHLRRLLLNTSSSTRDKQEGAPEELVSYALYALFRTASSLIGLFGPKLSRLNMVGLHELALQCCCCYSFEDVRVTDAAAVLWAALPLASNTPAVQWNRAVTETVDALVQALGTVTPIGVFANTKNNAMPEASSSSTDKTVWNIVQECWIPLIEQASSEDAKVKLFQQLVHGLVRVIQALLTREVVGVGAATAETVQAPLRDCQVNVDALLRLVDGLLNFSTAAESKFYATKKRLRPEPLTHGLLSPMALARDVANPLRWLGHALLDSVVSALRTVALAPYARRISKMVQSAMLVASSSTLRQALDPTAALLLQQQGKKRPRWLHTSVALRTCAIQSLTRVISLFGIDPQPMFNTSSYGTARSGRGQGSTMNRAISIVCGIVVEELLHSGMDQQQQVGDSRDDDWGTYAERVQLVTAALETLTASLSCGGEFWSLTTRSLIDSVTVTCLSVAQQQLGRHSLTSQPSVQTALLSLGTASVLTPWSDGATSATALVDGLQRLARAWSCHQHPSVASSAALGVCKALSCPRVPALQIVTRSSVDNSNVSTESTVEFLVEKMKVVRDDEKRARLREAEEVVATAARAATVTVETRESKPSKKVRSTNPEGQVLPMAVSTANEPEENKEKNPDPSITSETRMAVIAPVAQDQVEEVEVQRTKQSIDITLVVPKAVGQDSVDDVEDDEDVFPMIVDCGPDDGE